MKAKLTPWTPSILCAFLSLIAVTSNLIVSFMNVTAPSSGVEVVFYCFLPVCFYLVGALLSKLKTENRELRSRLDELTAQRKGDGQWHTAGSTTAALPPV